MINCGSFKKWLAHNTNYSPAAINDVTSRMNRADRILAWNGQETYLFYLENNIEFTGLSVSVKSQIRKAVKYYSEYHKSA